MIVIITLLISIRASEGKTISNPAMVYCESMGYQYEVRTDPKGNEYGVCIFPDGTECDAWDFFKGKEGKSFSYCAKKGYAIETKKINKGTYQEECAECVSYTGFDQPQSPAVAPSKVGQKKNRIRMLDLMKRRGEPLILEKMSTKPRGQQTDTNPPQIFFSKVMKNAPVSLDWRNVDGHTYIGPVRDQGSCGSCYAFGAMASAEGSYNVATGSFDGNCADFSESYVMWCLGRLSQYRQHFFGCDGADWNYAELSAITAEGVLWENEFAYTTSDPGTCPVNNDPAIVFYEWGRISCGDIEAIKTAIATYGVIDVAVYVTSNFSSYDSGIFVDNYTSCNSDPCYSNNGTNHAVSLVGWGYDDTAGDYWILRNSWGSSWGEGGYMKIGVTSARVSCEATYLAYEPGAPTANFSSNSSTACVASTFKFYDASIGNPTQWSWTFTPGTVTFVNGTNSLSKNPEVQFEEEGVYTVSLTAENIHGSDTITKPGAIIVINGQTIRLEIVFDSYPQETSFEFAGVSRGPFNADQTSYSEDFCLSDGAYVFKITDSYGDGMCCSYGYGHYSLKNLSTGQTIMESPGAFGTEEITEFHVGCPQCKIASNREHRKEGRAYYDEQGSDGEGYYAAGSDQYLGKTGKVIVQLKEDPENYFVEGRCNDFPIQTTAKNRDHKRAGRAYKANGSGGYGYYAVGSNSFMGKSGRNEKGLTETSLNYYVLN